MSAPFSEHDLMLRACESLSKAWRDVTFEMFSNPGRLLAIRIKIARWSGVRFAVEYIHKL